ncbi:hypothetical protein ACROYT_G031939 [Oculina patagonica]
MAGCSVRRVRFFTPDDRWRLRVSAAGHALASGERLESRGRTQPDTDPRDIIVGQTSSSPSVARLFLSLISSALGRPPGSHRCCSQGSTTSSCTWAASSSAAENVLTVKVIQPWKTVTEILTLKNVSSRMPGASSGNRFTALHRSSCEVVWMRKLQAGPPMTAPRACLKTFANLESVRKMDASHLLKTELKFIGHIVRIPCFITAWMSSKFSSKSL